MVGWHLQCHGHEFEQTLGDGEGQGSLAQCSPWGRKESGTALPLNSNDSFSVVFPMQLVSVLILDRYSVQSDYFFPSAR